MHTCSSAAVVLQPQQIVYMITVQLNQRCTAGLNGWHGSARSAMHMRQRTAAVLQHAADCVHMITVQPQSRCTAGMNGWHGSAHSAMHITATPAVLLQHAARSRLLYMIIQLQSKMYSWTEWLAWLCLLSNAHMQQHLLL
jgi:hypothetical protein